MTVRDRIREIAEEGDGREISIITGREVILRGFFTLEQLKRLVVELDCTSAQRSEAA